MKRYGRIKTRKQRGGFDIIPLKNSDFKYTKDEKRILWNKHTYPIGEYIIALVQSIPWKKYSFKGKVKFLYYDDEDESLNYPLWIEKEIETTEIIYPPYYYFGGCVYEILNTMYRKQLEKSLHTFTDPTGDIDVRLCLPNIKIKDPDTFEYFNFLLEPDGKNNDGKDKYKINSFVNHYTKWIFIKVKYYLIRDMPRILFDKIFVDTEEFDYKTNYEASFADLTAKIGNLWLVRTVINNMVKIQLIIKYKDIEESDHILEFVFPIETDITQLDDVYRTDSLTRCRSKYIILKNSVPIESLAELYSANIRAGKERIHLLSGDEYHHKFYNHIQRSLFLNSSLDNIINKPGEKNEDKITLSKNQYILLCTAIYNYSYWILANIDNICRFLYENNPKLNECDVKDVIRKLIVGIENILYKKEKNVEGNRIPYYDNSHSFKGKKLLLDDFIQIQLEKKEGGKYPKKKFTIKSKNRKNAL